MHTKISENTSAAARLEKVVVNTGIGRLSSQGNFNDKLLAEITKDFSLITGQKPAFRPAKRSISGFKVREGAVVGLKATLRSKRMADFLAKVVKVVMPRIRDFRGLDLKNVDQNGNLNFGIKENIAFPEINPEAAKTNFGVEITVVPKNIKNREEAMKLYKEMGILFKKK